jgi:hypothetical protein
MSSSTALYAVDLGLLAVAIGSEEWRLAAV